MASTRPAGAVLDRWPRGRPDDLVAALLSRDAAAVRARIRTSRLGQALSWMGLSPRGEKSVTRAIDVYGKRWGSPEDDSGERPVFVLASGWRSGSTLLQRLIISSRDVFVWGEPYTYCDVIRSLAETVRPISQWWPRAEDVWSEQAADVATLSSSWIACLSPPAASLVEAHRAFLRTLLAVPDGVDAERWGLKEVHLSGLDARYLKWLFPQAQFVFLHRNPYDQWRSYTRYRGWFEKWPRRRVNTPERFGALWRRLTDSFLQQAESVDALVVSYDSLINDPAAIDSLESHLGIKTDRSVLASKVGGLGQRAAVPLSTRDLLLLRWRVEPLASRLGYRPADAAPPARLRRVTVARR